VGIVCASNMCTILVVYFYRYAYPVRGCYELNEIEQIRSATTYAHLELGVPENFLALTSIEGQGITLFDKESGAIFDVEFGEFEELTSGKLLPIANSVSEFLLWCKNRENA
jgi:hypothetical protein